MPTPTPPITSPAEPRHAATILLVREERGEIEVLLTRRHEQMAFMGGMWVFPGGALSSADMSSASLALFDHSPDTLTRQLRDLQGAPLPSPQNQGLIVAAYRETFEETGVLLARATDGHHDDDEVWARMQGRRHAIVSQPEGFATFLQEQRLRLDLDRVIYRAHWITPSVVPKRFDTRFFLACMPPRQTVTIDAIEAIEMAWLTPVAVIAAARDQSMTLSPPTLYNVMELADSVREHGSLHAIFANESRRDVAPVMPKISAGIIVMPWDEDYHALAGVGVPRNVTYSARLRALPSRFEPQR